METPSLENLWSEVGFTPNDEQRRAIEHLDGALFLTAGPGSGKTRVILWRTLNLLVYHNVKPEEIFLSTFTEKAAFQLKQGLQSLLGLVTNKTGRVFDIAPMYIGTVHSLCQRILADRAFAVHRERKIAPVLIDALGQYFYLGRRSRFLSLLEKGGFERIGDINSFFSDGEYTYDTKHKAVNSCLGLFNRFSEDCLRLENLAIEVPDEMTSRFFQMYDGYLEELNADESGTELTDFSLLQQKAFEVISRSPKGGEIFKHVIVDEYQDTNRIQERIFFALAKGSKNICVVGDDDQALYRFRGASVENFVEFPERCEFYLQTSPTTIPLNTNYRSRNKIVEFYTDFIDQCDWRRTNREGYHRIVDKGIHAHSTDNRCAVVTTSKVEKVSAYREIVDLVKNLIETGKVQDPNQIAFLFPKFKNSQPVQAMKSALEDAGLRVYAPRAGRFLEVEESVSLFGCYLAIFGKPEQGDYRGEYLEYHGWMDHCLDVAKNLMSTDKGLKTFIQSRKNEVAQAAKDYSILSEFVENAGWDIDQPFDPVTMYEELRKVTGISETARKTIFNRYFQRIIKSRIEEGKPFSLSYILNAATSLDWNVLDLFYRLCGFEHFKRMSDVAEKGENRDEGPICNLGLISQYLARYIDDFGSVFTGKFLKNDGVRRNFFMSFLYSIYRLNESEYENVDDPFPKGRIPFLTIHQAKGLEFPVVVLGHAYKMEFPPSKIETMVRPLLEDEGEPLNRIDEFDAMRMFYVALSRAENLLVIADPKGGRLYRPFKEMFKRGVTTIPNLNLDSVPAAKIDDSEIPKIYSYTSDYLLYQKCPRQYMIFRKYGFVASRSQTQFFGTLVHETLEDLHHLLINEREIQGV